MADIDGSFLPTLTSNGSTTLSRELPGAIAVLGVQPLAYMHQAADSVTGAVYYWDLPYRSHAGQGYPGPNAPVGVRIRGPYLRVVQ